MVHLQPVHPTPEELSAFNAGRLSESDTAGVARHVEACEDCLRALDGIPPDKLDLFMQAAGTTPYVAGLNSTALSAPTPAGSPGIPAALANHSRYRLIEKLGEGGMGEVYKAIDREMERPVAIKLISKRWGADRSVVDRFKREIKLAAKLSHENVAAAYDTGQHGDVQFLVLEYVEGTSLERVLKERGRLPVGEACDYARQAAAGLHHAYTKGLVHRDIKPSNLMLTPEGKVKILDFGLARFVHDAAMRGPRTQPGRGMGTVDYMAPEQALDASTADARADIYSLGCTLYHFLAGQPPFLEGEWVRKAKAHATQTPRPLREFRDDVSEDLAAVVSRMMEKSPADRFQTPAEVAEAVAPFVARDPGPAGTLATSVLTPKAAPERPASPDRPSAAKSGPANAPGPRQPPKATLVRAAWLAAAATIVLVPIAVGVAYGPTVYRIVTNRGQLVIETNDLDVEVVITRGGEKVRVVDLRAQTSVELTAGKYELKLSGEPENLQLETDSFTLRRGGKQIVAIRWNPNAVRVAASNQGKEVRRFVGHDDWVMGVAFVPSASQVLSCSGNSEPPGLDNTLRLWDAGTGRELRRFIGHEDDVNAIVVTPDSRFALSSWQLGADGAIVGPPERA